MSEAISHKNYHQGPLNPPARQALSLWLACHRLGGILEDLSDQAPPSNPLDWPDPTNIPWPTPPLPSNQLVFQEWLLSTASSIFQCESLPDSPIFTLDAPSVKGLVIYGARCGTVNFYAAWVGWSGTFVGWTRKLQTNGEM